MAKLIDDTDTLDRIADEIVAERAPHVTAAIRAMGIPRGHPDERRLLKKWVNQRAIRVRMAEARKVHAAREEAIREDAYHRGWMDGWQKALSEAQKIRQGGDGTFREIPVERRPSWLSRLFTWAT